MLSASGMSLSNGSSSLLLKVSHLVANTPYPLFECFINNCIWSTSRGSPNKESVGGLTLLGSRLSKFLSAVGSIFQILLQIVRLFRQNDYGDVSRNTQLLGTNLHCASFLTK